MAPSRSESRTRLKRANISYKELKQEGSLIEELERATPPPRRKDKSPEREVPMNVMKRAISLAKCRVQSTPPRSAPRMGKVEVLPSIQNIQEKTQKASVPPEGKDNYNTL